MFYWPPAEEPQHKDLRTMHVLVCISTWKSGLFIVFEMQTKKSTHIGLNNKDNILVPIQVSEL